MDFPYDDIAKKRFFSLIIFLPILRIRTVQIHHHSPVAVYPCCFCIDIGCLLGGSIYRHLVGIIGIYDISCNFNTPHAFLAFCHWRFLYGAAATAVFIPAKHNGRCFRRPYLKCGFLRCIGTSQIVPVVSILGIIAFIKGTFGINLPFLLFCINFHRQRCISRCSCQYAGKEKLE